MVETRDRLPQRFQVLKQTFRLDIDLELSYTVCPPVNYDKMHV